MHDLPTTGVLILRLLLAIALAAAIGTEREVAGHPAGVRTHIAVALGAALFAVVSAYGFKAFDAPRNDTTFQVDPTRIASNIVVGIGFLGGGTILKEGLSVRGLTTAASLWVTAAIGLGCALGMYGVSVFAAAALLLSLIVLRVPVRLIRRRQRTRETVVIEVRAGADVGAVLSELAGLEGVEIRSLTVSRRDGRQVIEADVRGGRGADLAARLGPIAGLDDVADMDVS